MVFDSDENSKNCQTSTTSSTMQGVRVIDSGGCQAMIVVKGVSDGDNNYSWKV
jgi:hypothetical protein